MELLPNEQLQDAREALEDIERRADMLKVQCRAAWDAATDRPNEKQTANDILNRAAALIAILEDEINAQQEEIEAAQAILTNTATARPYSVTEGHKSTETATD